MSNKGKNNKKKVLIVVKWPLGGIRTYMRYTFSHFPESYDLTLLAFSTQEDHALRKDLREFGARLLLIEKAGLQYLMRAVFVELWKNRYDIILSQGFISSAAAYLPNLLFRIPHILTIHGILEPRFLKGRFKLIKCGLFKKILSDLTVLHAVSQDILDHLYQQFPSLNRNDGRVVVIPNGIKMDEFEVPSESPYKVPHRLDISDNTFLFGFFGRFMQQKGFDLLIDAIDILREKKDIGLFAVLAVGSGDYLKHYQKIIRDRDLEKYFIFLPFQIQVKDIYLEINTIVMPSRWEAAPLQPMEALSMGVPLIASNCIGLRETVQNTPVQVFESENLTSLVDVMIKCISNPNIEGFKKYIPIARQRFDAVHSADKLVQTIESLLHGKYRE